jgi:lipoate-protein ligase A
MKTRMIDNKTIEDLKERLRGLDELTILELLDVTSEELVEFLTDQVVERYDVLLEYLSDDFEET